MSEWPIGSCTTVSTIFNEVFTGFIFAFDKRTNIIVFLIPLPLCKYDVRICKSSIIKDVKYLENDAKLPTLHTVSLEKIAHRLEKSLRIAEQEKSKFNENVSEEAQFIFDSLVKTYCSFLII